MHTEGDIWVGIDGGGTGTRLVILDKFENVVATGLGPSSNMNSVGKENAKKAILEAYQKALKYSCLSNPNVLNFRVRRVCAGISGVTSACDSNVVRGWLENIFPGAEYSVYNDGVISLAAGTDGKLDGIAVISGTGCVSIGYNNLDFFQASGWGAPIGDEGSGYYIGNEALIAVLKAYDGRGAKTRLTELIVKYLNFSGPIGIVEWKYNKPSWENTAKLAPLVFKAAEEGDDVAKNIVNCACKGLFDAVYAVYKRLNFESSRVVPIVLCGKNLLNPNSLQESFIKLVSEKIPNGKVIFPQIEPSHAAAKMGWLKDNETPKNTSEE